MCGRSGLAGRQGSPSQDHRHWPPRLPDDGRRRPPRPLPSPPSAPPPLALPAPALSEHVGRKAGRQAIPGPHRGPSRVRPAGVARRAGLGWGSGVTVNQSPPRSGSSGRKLLDCPKRSGSRVRETFELHQLKSAPSQLLPVFSGFEWLQTCCC